MSEEQPILQWIEKEKVQWFEAFPGERGTDSSRSQICLPAPQFFYKGKVVVVPINQLSTYIEADKNAAVREVLVRIRKRNDQDEDRYNQLVDIEIAHILASLPLEKGKHS